MSSIQFDPRSPEFRTNPYPFYDMLRTAAPVFYWKAWDYWFLTRYEDCQTLLRDERLGHGQYRTPDEEQPLYEMLGRWMLFQDPPNHTRLRSLVHKAFTPRMVEHLRGTVQAITNRLIDSALEESHRARQFDLIASLAYPLPVEVIAEMFGVPAEDRNLFHSWSYPIARSLDLTEEEEVYTRARKAAVEFTSYLKSLSAQRRIQPRDDLLSALVSVEEEGDRLDEQELYATCSLLLIAGHETTVNLIGNGTLALLRHPEQLQMLRENPALIKTAIEELLRYDGPVQMTSRTVLQDMEYKGNAFRKGQEVSFMFGAANRDPELFENPNQLDISRQRNPHMAFGHGIHYCLGAPLARLEGAIAINTLLQRLPELTLAVDEVEYRDNYVLRGLEMLPVAY